ncbi:Signal-induced proliferation-associated 1-like protein 2 [Haplosporangium sp. Z 27]|nr:Signal-induced proliferation-associated 1-like protein 2 [Haplosporangium sp. Z 27]
MSVPPETSSPCPISGPGTLYKDTLHTSSTTQNEFSNENMTIPTSTQLPSLLPTVPSVSSSSPPKTTLSLPTTSDKSSTSSTLVHNQPSPENNCIHMSHNPNIGTSDSVSINSSNNSDSISPPAPPTDILDLNSNESSVQRTKSRSGSRSFGFLSSLGPKKSKKKSNKTETKDPLSASPSETNITTASVTSASPDNDMENITSQSLTSLGVFGELKDEQQQHKSGDNKRSKDKDNQHSHLGQRISKAIGLTSSSSKDLQNERRESGDSSLTTEANNNQSLVLDESNQQRDSPSSDKDRKGGLVSHFLRHKVMSSSDVSLPKSKNPSPVTRKVDEKRGGGLSSTLVIKSTTQSSLPTIPAQSTTFAEDSDTSTHSRHKDEHQTKGEKSWQTIPKRYGFGSSNEKSIVSTSLFNHRRGSLQIQVPQIYRQSITDVMEPSREIRPHLSRDDFERQDLCSRLGLTAGEGPVESMNSQMYSALAQRRCSLNPLLLSQHNNLSASNSSIDSNVSTTSPASTKPTSRLARLTKFKFPSINVGSLQKNKSSSALSSAKEPILNIRRGSLPAHMIFSQMESPIKSSPLINGSRSTSTFASVNTTGSDTLVGMTPGSSTYSNINSNNRDSNVTSISDGRKSRQSVSDFLEVQSHHPLSSFEANTRINSTQLTSSFSFPSHREVDGNQKKANRNTLPLYHRSTSKNNFGSEKFTCSTNGSNDQAQGPEKMQGHGFEGDIRSNILKRSSRRTVSASNISSDSIFAASGPEDIKSINPDNQIATQPRSERDISSTTPSRIENITETRLPVRTASVRKNLFGESNANLQTGTDNKQYTAKGTTGEISSVSSSLSGVAAPSTNTGSMGLPFTQYSTASNSSIRNLTEAFSSSVIPSQTLISSANPLMSTKDNISAHAVSGESSSSNVGKPLLTSAHLNAKNDHYGVLSNYTFPPVQPPTPSTSSTPLLKSKLSSLISGRHNNSSTSTSSTTTSATGKSSEKTVAQSEPRTNLSQDPNIPHREPRSAAADYPPIIHYKRQRSMSLQDADLLTADQFIALVPDDLSTKRRFSSEESPPENEWNMASKIRKARQPDPSTVLRSLVSTLQLKCGLVLKHLDSMAAFPSKTLDASATVEMERECVDIVPVSTTLVNHQNGVFVATRSSANHPDTSTLLPAGTLPNLPPSPINNYLGGHDQAIDAINTSNQVKSSETLGPCCGKANDQDHLEHTIDVEESDDNIEFSKDSLDVVTTLFDEMDHTVAQMTEILAKYISVDKFSKLIEELDDVCFLAQTVIRTEIDKRGMNNDDQDRNYGWQLSQESSIRTSQTESGLTSVRNFMDMSTLASRASIANTPTTTTTASSGAKVELGQRTEILEEKKLKNMASIEKINNHHGADIRQYEGSDIHLNMTSEEQQSAIRSYVESLLSTAETCVAEYMSVYNRMFTVPTPGFRIEGCNDLKKIERALRPDHPQTTSLPPPMATLGGAPQPSLLSHVSGVQHGESTSQETHSISQSPAGIQPNSATYMHPTESSSSINLDGQPIARVKSLSESNEWTELQKRKKAEGSPIDTLNNVGSSSATGVLAGSDNLTLRDYSQEHMGHEAYYYRNWFLGKEHRTYVGQVEGLGTVIISIIKDMVVPPGHSQIGPLISTSMSTSSSTASTSSLSVTRTTSINGSTRPKLTHSGHSHYSGKGASFSSSGREPSSNPIAGPRPSSEAMRIILSASTAVVTGSGTASEYISTPSIMASTHGGLPPTTFSHFPQASTPISSNSSLVNNQPNTNSNTPGSNHSAPQRWQYRCILRQKDVDSIRITFPEPEPSPLNNLTRRVAKPQWKNILQSIHPAITQQVASKLKKVETNHQFEKELAKFDETMLRFNYKFGVLLVHPGQTKEEDWFSNQMTSSPRFQEFLESGALGQKVTLKGFERFSAGLDTRSDNGSYSYFDTWGESFEIMYHVSTLLPFNTVDRQQIQRKRHIGNDIVCIVFVDGDHPFVPSTIKSQFLHIFVVIHPILLPDGTRGYSVAIACDEQVPPFGPPLPDPPIFKSPQELRAFLLSKMINGENAACKAPRLIKPHQRARSGMLESLVAKANGLTKDKESDKKPTKQKASEAATPGPSSTNQFAGMSSPSHSIMAGSYNGSTPSPTLAPYQGHPHQHNLAHHGCQDHHIHHCSNENERYCCCSPARSSSSTTEESQCHPNAVNSKKYSGAHSGQRMGARASIVSLGSETAASLFRHRRRDSNSDMSKADGNSIADETGSIERSQPVGPSPLSSSFLAPESECEHTPSDSSTQSNSDRTGCCACCSCCCTANPDSYVPAPPSSYTEYKFPPSKPTSVTTSDQPKKFGALQPQTVDPNSSQRARPGFPSPTEKHFLVNRNNLSHLERHQTRHSIGGRSELMATSSTEKKDANSLGMSISDNKGRSKSEIDLLRRTSQESSNMVTPKQSTADAIGSITDPAHNQSQGSDEVQQHFTASGPITISQANSNLGQTIAVPPHSSMKGRAHYFLSTLVRRRASSNDTSALGPTVHAGPKPSNLGTASPLGAWNSSNGYHAQPRTGNCPHHHSHGCHHQKHHHQHHHHARPCIESSSSHPLHYDNACHPLNLEQPLKFKEGYSLKSKAPMHINTTIAANTSSLMNSQNSSSHQQVPPLSSSTLSSTSSSSHYPYSSQTSASLQSSTGPSSAFSNTSNAASPTLISASGISPQSLKRLSSRDTLNRASILTDRRGSNDILSSSRVMAINPASWGSQRLWRGEPNDVSTAGSASGNSSAAVTPTSESTPIFGDLKNPVDVNNQTGWRFSESPLAYTPSSMRQRDSSNSFESSSSAGGLASSFPGSNTDYMNFKPSASSQEHVSPEPSTAASTTTTDQNVPDHLTMEHLALRDSHSLMAIDSDRDHFPSAKTFASIPSSASANTTAADPEISNTNSVPDLHNQEALMEDSMVNNVVKRATSVESFLKRDGVLVRMASLRVKGAGLQGSVTDSRRLLPSRVDPQYRPNPHSRPVLGEHGPSSKAMSHNLERDIATDLPSLEATDADSQATMPESAQTQVGTRLRKISESQNSYCSLEVEQLDVKFDIVI